MKSKTDLIFTDYEKAIKNLEYAVANCIDDLDIDGGIKRFELCYELAWKLIKAHLETTGIICKNPRDCFKAAKENDLIAIEINWLKMIEDRNHLVHVYTFEESRDIFELVKSTHLGSLLELYQAVRKSK